MARWAWVAVATVIILGAVSIAKAVVAPVAFALFLIAQVWPLQSRLQVRISALPALAVSFLVLMVAFGSLASLVLWASSRVGRWIIANLGRFEALYDQAAAWLDGHGVAVAGLWAEHLNAGWIVGVVRGLTGQANTILSFWLLVLVYVILGLLEVESTARKVQALPNRNAAHVLYAGTAQAADKIRRYMVVRTLMSVLTGLLVWAVAVLFGLPLAAEWGVIGFTLNYIPFIGPFIATLLPTLLAVVQYETWQAVIAIFVCLNVIQFVVGNYVEPRLSGRALSLSPFAVLLSVFLWTYLWGLSGTFIGVPITVTALAFCAQSPSTHWLAVLLGSPDGTVSGTHAGDAPKREDSGPKP
ncbi:AI-2E family transporter [Microvirga lupini]|uniref:AI-2E family transporter n=1 Tax=Microvirga lupini TaxID=420324 RepID=UPI001620CF2D